MRAVWLVVCVVGMKALAQEGLPGVAPFPLEVQRTPKGYGEKQRRELSLEYLRALSKVAQVPDKAGLDSALAALDKKGEDCGRDDECLGRFAQLSKVLYGLYARVDQSFDEKKIIVEGRVVRDDNVPIGQTITLEIPRGPREPFDAIAKKGIARLVERLVVTQQLSPVRPKPPPPPPVLVAADPAPPPVAPPLVVQATEPRPTWPRVAGWVGVGTGLAAGIAGAVVFATAPAVHKDAYGNILSQDLPAFQQAKSQQAAGVGLMIGGAAVAAVGASVVIISRDSESVRMSMSPMPGGAAVVVGGSLP